jgi:hypothetical protein
VRAYAGSESLRKRSAWAVVLSASDGFRHSLVAANSSGRRASSAGTGDATVGAGDERSRCWREVGRGLLWCNVIIPQAGN